MNICLRGPSAARFIEHRSHGAGLRFHHLASPQARSYNMAVSLQLYDLDKLVLLAVMANRLSEVCAVPLTCRDKLILTNAA